MALQVNVIKLDAIRFCGYITLQTANVEYAFQIERFFVGYFQVGKTTIIAIKINGLRLFTTQNDFVGIACIEILVVIRRRRVAARPMLFKITFYFQCACRQSRPFACCCKGSADKHIVFRFAHHKNTIASVPYRFTQAIFPFGLNAITSTYFKGALIQCNCSVILIQITSDI